MNSTVKTVVFWLVIVLSGVLLWQVVKNGNSGAKEREINFSQFLSEVDQGNVSEVTIIGPEVRGKFKNDKAGFHTTVPPNYTDMIKELRDKGVNITVKDAQGGGWPSWLLNLAPFILLGALWFIMIRQMQTGGNKALSFGKSRARLLSMQQKKVTFKDVAGVDEAKEELQGDHRVPARGAEVPEARRTHSQGRAAGRTSGNRQDPAGPRRRRRSQRSVLQHLRFGLCRDVRRRRRKPRPRPLRAGQEERSLHHLHRRNRRRRPSSRRRPRRWTRRARADPEPVAGRDGRLRIERRRHPDRRHQPS